MLCSQARRDRRVCAAVENRSFAVKETTPGVEHKLCDKTYAQGSFLRSPLFTRGGEEWGSQSSENGPICLSRRVCHVLVL